MWLSKGHGGKKGGGNGLVAVAIDKDKGSQSALKWATENLLTGGQTVVLIHVIHKSSSSGNSGDGNDEKLTKELFLTFHCFCTRKDIHCLDITLEDTDVVKALTEYVSHAAIENLVLGATSRHGFIRFKTSNLPSSVSKGSPDFCTVYVISKGKISSVRNASRAAPYTSPLLNQIQDHDNRSVSSSDSNSKYGSFRERISIKPRSTLQTLHDDPVKSPFARGGRRLQDKWSVDYLDSDTDISFVSSGRPSTDRTSSFMFESMDSAPNSRLSTSTTESFGSTRLGHRLTDNSSRHDFSTTSEDNGRTSCSSSSQGIDDVEAEMRRLKLELKQTMDMYSTACKEALTAQRKTKEMNHWKLEEERRLEEARTAEESAMAMAERERAKCRAAVEAAEAAQRIAELEAQRRLNVEMKALKESEEMKKSLGTQPRHDIRYRRYSIEEIEEATDFFTQSRKIGEGGYGPVYKCYLDHTPVAVKVLRPDAAQGRSQFQQEVEVLSCIRHPNMVLLLGACPEYGCLVYEYMAKGSLDDRLFRRGNSPVISWQLRFRIAAEIATGLLFLHQTKPEPLVHRDLKPGNILLDHNYVSKISDVGLARLVPTVAENVTQCCMTSTAGTFCYIDPEYQQTGMLGVKSDVYSLGIMFLQLITAKPPMGLAHYVEMAIENGTFADMLDPAVPDWPVEEVLRFAKLALQCAELRRKDRPDLCKEILPELCRLRELGDENMTHFFVGGSAGPSPNHSQVSVTQDTMSESGSTTSSLSGTQ